MSGSYGVLSKVVDVSSQGSYGDATHMDATADFVPQRWRFSIDGANGDEVFISFDRSTTHGYIKKGASLQDLVLHVPHKNVWVKKGAAAGTLKVVIHADAGC